MDGISSVFHVGGIISGMDTDSIVSKLVALDSKPITDAQSHQQSVASSQVAWKQLTASLLGLKASADALSQPASFTNCTATASDPQAMTLTTGSGALPGNVNVTIKQLAMSNQILSQGYDDATSAPVGTGTIQLQLGAAIFSPVVIDASNNNLQGMVDAINKTTSGIQASIVNDGSSSKGYHLLLTSRATGAANAISVGGDLGSKFTFTTMQPPQDAQVVIGATGGTPLTVTSSTNTVTNAMPGVSMQLLKPADNVNVSVTRDTNSVKAMVTGFISNYNSIATFYSQNMFYDASTKKAGILEGDTSAVALQDQLSQIVTGNAGSGSIRNLASLGITLTPDGQLTVSDSKALENALQNNPDDVKSLFTDSTSGLGKQVSKFVDTLQDPKSGLLGIKVNELAESYTALGDYITEQKAMVSSKEAIYRQQFMDMEVALSSLQSQSSAMSSLLGTSGTSTASTATAGSATAAGATSSTSVPPTSTSA